jgi:hypothetical protein
MRCVWGGAIGSGYSAAGCEKGKLICGVNRTSKLTSAIKGLGGWGGSCTFFGEQFK